MTGRPADPRAILALARERGEEGFTTEDLYEALGCKRRDRPAARTALRELVEGGRIHTVARGRYRIALAPAPVRAGGPGGEPFTPSGLLPGRIEVHPDGFAFLIPDDASRPDVFLPRGKQGGAVHGDRVAVRITHRRGARRLQGEVRRVLEPTGHRIVGLLTASRPGGKAVVIPFDSRAPHAVVVESRDRAHAPDSSYVEVEIDALAGPGEPARGRVTRTIGRPGDPGVDVEVVSRHFGLTARHPDGVLAEAEALARDIPPGEIRRRADLRGVPTVTIDGETAQDFDDAVSVEALPRSAGGGFALSVSIADVAHYVRPGTALDHEALRRGTSVYFPGTTFHMLPERLSQDLCSLRPGEDRLALTVEMEVSPEGKVRRARFRESVIHSAERMTYTALKRILVDGDETLAERYAPLLPAFRRMEACALALAGRREKRGSLDFDLPEPILVLDDAGGVREVLPSERNVAHRIIEEFMIAANEAVARHLRAEGLPTLYRVHEEPDAERIADLYAFLRGLGIGPKRTPPAPDPRDIQALLRAAEGRPEERLVSELTLRSMSKARYSPANLGHFGLASDCYVHFTSPIRRYPDLVVHRVLKGWLGSPAGEPGGRLDAVADRCSERERNAEAAERAIEEWKKVQYLAGRTGEEMDGVVSGVHPRGVFVDLGHLALSGLVPREALPPGAWSLDETGHAYRSVRGRGRIRIGDPVRVRVKRADVTTRRVDLELVRTEA